MNTNLTTSSWEELAEIAHILGLDIEGCSADDLREKFEAVALPESNLMQIIAKSIHSLYGGIISVPTSKGENRKFFNFCCIADLTLMLTSGDLRPDRLMA